MGMALMGVGSASASAGAGGPTPLRITSNGGGATAGVNVPENTTAVTTVTAVGGATPRTFSLNGGADVAFFAINASTGVLTFLLAPDFETPLDAGANNTYVVGVRVTDDDAATADQTITVTVTNVTNPNITSNGGGSTANVNAAENQTAVTTVTADNGTAPYTFSISGTDSAFFSINASTGVLAFLVAPDFETPADSDLDNVYVVTVRATATTGEFDEQTISVTVTDVSETPPTFAFTSDGGAAEVYRYLSDTTTTVATVAAGPAATGYSITAQDTSLLVPAVDSGGIVTLGVSVEAGYGSTPPPIGWYWYTNEESDMKIDVTVEATDGSATAQQVQRLVFEPDSADDIAGNISHFTKAKYFQGDGTSFSNTFYARIPLTVTGSFDLTIVDKGTATVNMSDDPATVVTALGVLQADGGFAPKVFDRNGFREIYFRGDSSGGGQAGSVENNSLA